MYDLIVIGAGPGGYEAAAHAGHMGKSVALVEKNALGGTCLNVGCIPTKTLLKSAHVLAECRRAESYGVTTSESALDLAMVQQRKERIVAGLVKGVGTLLKRAGVDVITGEAAIVERGVVAVGDRKLETKSILIATGSAPAMPPIPGIDSDAVMDSTALLDVSRIPESMVIIGGGVIGLEFASFFATIGTAVTVVEMLPTIGSSLDRDMSKRLQSALAKQGVKFNLSCKVSKIDGGTVHFSSSGGDEKTVTGEIILNATGRVAVTKNLGLENIGVQTDRGFIVTSPEGRTSVDGIWACGDVTGRCLLAHAATREGIVAVNSMFGVDDSMDYSAVPAVIYTSPELATVGRTQSQLTEAGVAFKSTTLPMGVSGRFTIENEGAQGAVKMLVEEDTDRILGVQMLGGPAGEIIYGAAAMIEKGFTVHEAMHIVFPHPTISEVFREAIALAVRL